MDEIRVMTGISLRRLLGRVRFLVGLLLVPICVWMCYAKVPPLLAEKGMSLQAAEPFILLFCPHWTQLFLLLSLLLLLGDVPYLHEGMETVAVRTSKGKWLLSQTFASLGLIALWMVWIQICTLAVFRGYLHFENRWSTLTKLLARTLNQGSPTKVGFELGVYPNVTLITGQTPYGMLWKTALLNFVLFAMLVIWSMMLNLLTKRSYGSLLVVALWAFRFGIQRMAPLYDLAIISPMSLTELRSDSLTTARMAYILLFYALHIVLLWILSRKRMKRLDMTKLG